MARAIYGVIVISKMMPWDDLLPHHRELFLEQADAALDALMEPTAEMIEDGNNAVANATSLEGYESSGYDVEIAPTCARDTLRAMLTKAKDGK